MEGLHIKGSDRFLPDSEFVVAGAKLPPGKYMVFANAHIGIASTSPAREVAYRARLALGNIHNDLIGSLKFDFDDPGSRYESIALSVAGQFDADTFVGLSFFATSDNVLVVNEPRVSVLGLGDLQIIVDRRDYDETDERFYIYSIALAGAPTIATG
jgi:hypothetical protein